MWFTKFLGFATKFIGIASGFLQLSAPVLPSSSKSTVAEITDDLTKAASAVQTAAMVQTALQGAHNPSQAVAGALPLVAQIIQQAEFVSGHKIANEAQFTQGVQKITDGLHDVLSSLGD